MKATGFRFVAFLFAALFGVYLNPWLTTADQQWRVFLAGELCFGFALLGLEVLRGARLAPGRRLGQARAGNLFANAAVLTIIYALWLWLFRTRWLHPSLFADDYRYLAQSCDWPTTLANLFVPFNEHLAAPTRLWTFLMVCAAAGGDPAPWLAATSAIFFAPALALTFLVGKRIGSGDEGGLAAAGLFALSICYDEVVAWYAAAQWLIPLSLLLSALLMMENASLRRMVGGGILAFFAPFAFSLGVLVGPLAALWAINGGIGWRAACVPLLGGSAGAVWAGCLIRRSMDEAKYWDAGGRGLLQAFDPLAGCEYTARLVVDRLLLTNLGWRAFPTPRPLVAVFLGCAIIGGVFVLRRWPACWRYYPAAVLILMGFGIAVPFRTWEKYVVVCNWTRYQLFPYLGLSLLMVGVYSEVGWIRPGRIIWRRAGGFAILAILWVNLQNAGRR